MTSLACLEPPAKPTVDIDGMSSIEAMAKSRHDCLHAGGKPVAWDETIQTIATR